MAILNQKRILNLIPKVSAPVTIHVSQGDVGTEIEFTLVKGDEVFSDTGNLTASVHGIREDGANFGPFTCTLSGSKVTFPLHSEMTAVKGSALAEIVLVDNGGNKVGSANFGIMVEESVFPLGVTYDNDVSIYESILAYVQTIPAQVTEDYINKINAEIAARQAADTSLNNALASEASARISADSVLGARIDQIIAPSGEAPNPAEITDARIGASGVVFDTLGNAIRTQFDVLKENIDILNDSVYTPGTTNLYEQHSADMLLAIDTTSFSQGSSLYGFYIPIDPSINTTVTIERKNIGERFRVVATQDVPAVGVTYASNKVVRTDSSSNRIRYNKLDSNDRYLYIAYYSSSVDTITKEQALAEMKIYYGTEYVNATNRITRLEEQEQTVYEQLFPNASTNFYSESISALLQFDTETHAYATAVNGKGFYVPIDTENGTTITIKRKSIGARFRCATSEIIPSEGVPYTNYNIFDDTNEFVLSNIDSSQKYLYVLYYNSEYDVMTEEQCLDGMLVFYGTEQSIIKTLTSDKKINFVNGIIDSTGNLVYSAKHITSDYIKVDGLFGVSCPSDYSMKVSFYYDDGIYSHDTTITNSVSYISHSGLVRVTISATDATDITPSTVDFSKIKMPSNRFSALSFTNEETFVLDSENCASSDVYDYIDSVVDSHSQYASKTLLCTESSGLPIYYYLLGDGSQKLCLVSGQHGPGSGGDPRDSVITTAKLIHDLIDGNFDNNSFLKTLHDEYTILVIPILNPYGFNNRTRTDANGDDTNRDWTTPTTIEVVAAKTLIASFNPDIALDIHCNGTTPLQNVNVELQFGLGTTHNPLYKSAIQDKFKSYYNTDVASRTPNSSDTLQYYIQSTLGILGGLIEMRWWIKNKKWMHDYQAESANYAMLVNILKYCKSVADSETFVFEKTPNQNQY